MIEILKADLLQARRDKDRVKQSILQVLIAEIELSSKRKNSADPINILKKLVDNVTELMDYSDDPHLRYELDILHEYLPETLTERETITELASLSGFDAETNPGKRIGLAMKHFKENDIPVDGKLVSKVAREWLD